MKDRYARWRIYLLAMLLTSCYLAGWDLPARLLSGSFGVHLLAVAATLIVVLRKRLATAKLRAAKPDSVREAPVFQPATKYR